MDILLLVTMKHYGNSISDVQNPYTNLALDDSDRVIAMSRLKIVRGVPPMRDGSMVRCGDLR